MVTVAQPGGGDFHPLYEVSNPCEESATAAVDLDGTRLAAGGDGGAVSAWDARRGTRLATVAPPTASAVATLRLRGPLAAAGGTDGHIRLWDLETGRCVAVFKVGIKPVLDFFLTKKFP